MNPNMEQTHQPEETVTVTPEATESYFVDEGQEQEADFANAQPIESTAPDEALTASPAADTPVPTATVESATATVSVTPPSPNPLPEPANHLLFPLLFAIAAVALLAVTLVLLLRKKRKKPIPAPPLPNASYRTVTAGGCQYLGTRPNQEDAYGISNVNDPKLCESKGILAVVADGIGGMDNGQVASKMVVETMGSEFYQESSSLPSAIRLLTLTANAHLRVNEYRKQQGIRCGSTLVAVLIEKNDLYFISVGDSRILLYRQGGLIQLNREHKLGTLMEERTALKDVSPSSTRKPSALTSHMGMEDLRQIDRNPSPVRLMRGDKILLLSDGVYGVLSEAELLMCLGDDAQKSANAICDTVRSKQRRSQDNATAVVLNIW